MRILALTNLYPNPYQPNRATFNRQQFAALAQGHEVRVIAPISWTDEWSARRHSRDDLMVNRQRVCDGMIVDHPRYLFTPKVLRGSYGRFVIRSVRTCFDTAVREFRPDAVLGCWAYPDGWAAVRLARQAGLPVIVKVHGSDLLTATKQRARLLRTQETLTSADAVVAVSQQLHDRAVLLGADPARVSVVYNGVDHRLFHPGPRPAARERLGVSNPEPLILFVGNLVPVKGIDVLLSALATVSARGVGFQCALVGEGPLKAELQRQIDVRGLTASVRLIGSRPLEELPHWYRAADLVVLPSRSEGVPNVLLEATACDTPFIATRVGGISEIAPADWLVPPDDAAALAERIGAFLQSPRQKSNPFRAGTWADSARAMAVVLEGAIADARQRVGQAA
jgi:glycosyltransferase involved in cell wall biosynthesis